MGHTPSLPTQVFAQRRTLERGLARPNRHTIVGACVQAQAARLKFPFQRGFKIPATSRNGGVNSPDAKPRKDGRGAWSLPAPQVSSPHNKNGGSASRLRPAHPSPVVVGASRAAARNAVQSWRGASSVPSRGQRPKADSREQTRRCRSLKCFYVTLSLGLTTPDRVDRYTHASTAPNSTHITGTNRPYKIPASDTARPELGAHSSPKHSSRCRVPRHGNPMGSGCPYHPSAEASTSEARPRQPVAVFVSDTDTAPT